MVANCRRASTARARRRPWRARGRKGQASAVATILGLLLVVTFIANYLSTTLPQQMTINEVTHELTVENQVGTLAALLVKAGTKDAVGAELTQPVTLGTAGEPPFAPAEAGAIGPSTTGVQEYVQVALTGGTGGLVTQTSYADDLVVQLYNSYTPATQIAYDSGAVVFAQEGGRPVFVDPPPMSISGQALTIFVPIFSAQIGTESGTGTAIVAFSLTSETSQTFPGGGYLLASGNAVQLKVTTPFAQAWMSYLGTNATFAKDAKATCSGTTVCSGLYRANGGLGTVTIDFSSSVITKVTVEVATYTVTLH